MSLPPLACPLVPHIVQGPDSQLTRGRRGYSKGLRVFGKSAEASGRRCIGCENSRTSAPLFCLEWVPPVGDHDLKADGSPAPGAVEAPPSRPPLFCFSPNCEA